MICISVAPESRKLAKVDLFNASSQGDMIEMCLDHLLKQPDVGDLLAGAGKPVVVSCRRAGHGGRWEGSEDDRKGLLRQAIAAGPDYVELDLDIAQSIPRFARTKRILCVYGDGDDQPDIAEIVSSARKADADVLRLLWETPTLESTRWLLGAIAESRDLPIVIEGIGDCAPATALIARKRGLNWVYAALEKGMEAQPGQPTITELKDIYDIESIGSKTQFLGMVGLEFAQAVTVQVFNAAFHLHNLGLRCLPFDLSQFDHLAETLKTLKVKSMLIGPKWGKRIMPFAAKAVGSAEPCEFADLLLGQRHGWEAYNTIWRHSLYATEEAFGKTSRKEMPLARKSVLLVGANGLAQAMAHGVVRRRGICSVTAPDDVAAQRLAGRFDVRHVPFANLYDTLADVVIFTDPSLPLGPARNEFNPSYLRPNMTVTDLSRLPHDTDLLSEARYRGATVVDPKQVYVAYLRAQFESITRKELPDEAVHGLLTGRE